MKYTECIYCGNKPIKNENICAGCAIKRPLVREFVTRCNQWKTRNGYKTKDEQVMQVCKYCGKQVKGRVGFICTNCSEKATLVKELHKRCEQLKKYCGYKVGD